MHRTLVLIVLAFGLAACDWFVPEAQVIKLESNLEMESAEAIFVPYLFQSPEPDPRQILARCLTRRGVVLYSTKLCGPCQRQRALFGPYTNYLNIVDCGDEPVHCRSAGVRQVPTWIFPNGSRYPGVRTLRQLARRARCPYPRR